MYHGELEIHFFNIVSAFDLKPGVVEPVECKNNALKCPPLSWCPVILGLLLCCLFL